jgi:two-component system, OmpR family, sensor histidine kinase BaeS
MPFSHTYRRIPHRPPWWPENEPFPPVTPRGRFMRSRFFRRIGCVFMVFSLTFFVATVIAVDQVARALGLFQPRPGFLIWPFFPIGFVILFVSVFLFVTGRIIRRASTPFGALLEASDKVANGDYSTRIPEAGPSEMNSVVHAFNHMASRLEEAQTRRQNLLADVSHELRNPLTVIQGSLEGMLDGVYQPDEDHLKALLEETQVLSRLVDDLRTLAQAEGGTLQLKKVPADLAELVEEVVAGFLPQAAAANIRLEAHAEADLPLVDLDPQRLHEVFTNLVANALRYTPAGGSIQVQTGRTGSARLQGGSSGLSVRVSDTGAGIAPQDLAHIFDRFYKGRDSTGMGLGLAIARSIVEAHGGTITAKSQPGSGTTLTVTLPVDNVS